VASRARDFVQLDEGIQQNPNQIDVGGSTTNSTMAVSCQ
jgi:hypothetical protein